MLWQHVSMLACCVFDAVLQTSSIQVVLFYYANKKKNKDPPTSSASKHRT